MKSDIEIAQEADLLPIQKIAKKLDISDDDIELYGKYKCKINTSGIEDNDCCDNAKLILVSAMTPTPAGEGKTTISIGIADALAKYFENSNKKVMLALREPSLGPVFGIKGGATGGGYSQVVPMEDINLHFTGDFHAIGSANNLLAAMLDNHIQQGNKLNIDVKSITWKRVVDMNDRQLRNIVDGLGGKMQGVPREDGFDITVASEIMAIFCLATSLKDLKGRLGRIIVAYNFEGDPVTASDLHAQGAMTALLKDAFKPNLVQTLQHTPAIVHGGPFANIAHGCNSVIATKTALKLADYVITEAGFGADLGAEKFLDIKCRYSKLKPSLVVVVATIRALKLHGGAAVDLKGPQLIKCLKNKNIDALKIGFSNLSQHVLNIKNVYKLPCLVVVNQFDFDSDDEIKTLLGMCKKANFEVALSQTCTKGMLNSYELASKVVKLTSMDNSNFNYCYTNNISIEQKIESIAKQIYHAKAVEYSKVALQQLKKIQDLGLTELPVCIAKTQYSFSDDQAKLCVPENFVLHVRELIIKAGAGFIVALTGSILTMPGLPKKPAAENIDVDKFGKISGLF